MDSKKRLCLTMLFFFTCIIIFPQSTNSLSVTDEKYIAAKEKADSLIQIISNFSDEKRSGYSPRFIVSIVFPELIRYSAEQDKIEAFADMLTAQSDSPVIKNNFSIGQMQMKPSFAQQVERYISQDDHLQQLFSEIDFSGNDTINKDREDRIKRLCNQEMQIQYLLAFVSIVNTKFSKKMEENHLLTEQDKLYVFATVYNGGFSYDFEQLKDVTNPVWNYTTIAAQFFAANS